MTDAFDGLISRERRLSREGSAERLGSRANFSQDYTENGSGSDCTEGENAMTATTGL
jgi:hypothetical protein